jgi:hypothetical protein
VDNVPDDLVLYALNEDVFIMESKKGNPGMVYEQIGQLVDQPTYDLVPFPSFIFLPMHFQYEI